MFYRGFDENDYMFSNTYDIYGGIQPTYNGYNYNIQRNTWQKDLYPEIYNIIYPVITNICSKRNIYLNEESLENLVTEIYSKIEEDSSLENRKEEREQNLLKDLIRILIIREFFPRRRPRPRPPHRAHQEWEMPYREFYHPFPEEYM